MKKFSQLLKEQNETEKAQLNDGIHLSIEDFLKEKIEKSLNSTDASTVKEFIEAFLKDSENNKIEGLINDSDVFDFYVMYRNEIDEKLAELKYYNEIPSENGVFTLYDFIVDGTIKAVKEFLKKL